MNAGILASVLFGAVASVFCFMALVASMQLKTRQGHAQTAVIVFWGAVGGYFTFYTVLRFLAFLDLSSSVLTLAYQLQTTSGAITITGLAAIVLRVAFKDWMSGFLTALFVSLAALTLYMIVVPGQIGPRIDLWSVEFLPESLLARGLVATVYVIIPAVFAGMIVWATKWEGGWSNRFHKFAASVVLMFIPSAIKYVVFVEGLVGLALAIVSAYGCYLGWRSYVQPPESSGNG